MGVRMGSSFAWVDFSEADRRRTQDVLDLLKERDTRDELGIGVVRDALADLLFPGTSTLQTRARYFLFIPWLYQRLADKGIGSSEIDRRARNAELGLIAPLKENDDHDGIIGAAAEERLLRLPSSVYWAGLGTLGIRRFPGSQSQYHRAFERVHEEAEEADDDGEQAAARGPWDPHLPEASDGFPTSASLELSFDEAEYLQHRIQSRGVSLFGELVRRNTVVETTDFPWQRSDAEGWRVELQEHLGHARAFSEALHGAALLYNLMLAEELKHDEWIADYREALGEWASMMDERGEAHRAWSREAFWGLIASREARVSLRTRNFVDTWLDHVVGKAVTGIGGSAGIRDLIRRREQQLKRGRARLGNPGALARWGGSAGSGQLNFRWHRVQVITADILRGLAKRGE
jgi:hypothetical protein